MLSYLQAFDAADVKFGSKRIRQKTEVIFYISDLDNTLLTGKSAKSAPWPPSTRRCVATSYSGSRWDHRAESKTSSWQQWMSFEPCANVFSCVKIRRQNLPFLESLGGSRINHIFRERGHAVFQWKRRSKLLIKLDKWSLERLYPGLTEDCAQQAALSTCQPRIGCKESVVARPTHLGALIEARPRIHDTVRDATIAGLS